MAELALDSSLPPTSAMPVTVKFSGRSLLLCATDILDFSKIESKTAGLESMQGLGVDLIEDTRSRGAPGHKMVSS